MITLEKFEAPDYDQFIGWMKSEEMLMQVTGPQFTFPLTADQLNASLSNTDRYAFKVMETQSGEAIGHAEIYAPDTIAYFGRIIIGDEKQRSKGTGYLLMQALLAYAFITLKKQTAALTVFDWNVSAIKCYKSAGFVLNPDKKLEQTVKEQTWTALNMVIEKQHWLKHRANKIS